MSEDGKIESLQKKLYSNAEESQIPVQRRAKLPKHSVMVGSAWEEDPESVNPIVSLKDPADRGTVLKKIFLVAILFFMAAATFTFYVLYNGINSVSNGNIDIRLLGPIASPAGDELSLDVNITNRNKTDLVLSDLVIAYPEGTRDARDHLTSMLNDRIELGTIPAGQTVRKTIKSILFGEENVKKNVKVSLEYRIDGSSNIFVKDKDYPIFIGSSPIAVQIDARKEVVPGQESDFSISIKSNSSNIIRGLILKADYPFGFEFNSAVPAASVENNIWVLGDIKPGEERNIELKGSLLGGENQERVFRFYTGTEDPSDKMALGTIFVNNSIPVSIKKPFLGADISLDGKSTSVVIAHAGDSVKGEVTWQNNLNVDLTDVVIEARLGGAMLDKSAVVGEQGFYRSIDNTIVWDRTLRNDLKTVTAGENGHAQFSFAAVEPTQKSNSEFRRQSMNLELTIRAKRFDEDNVPQELTSTVTRTIKVSSDLDINSRLVRTIGPFENSGPVPPMPEQKSTYTVLISLANSYNNVKDVVYKATLPQYVEWLSATYPNNAGVKYNADTRELTWSVGDIAAGTGYSSSPKEFAFQVSFLPSVGQIGKTPSIITNQRIAGKDTFTGGIVEDTPNDLDIKISTDGSYKFGDEKVGGK